MYKKDKNLKSNNKHLIKMPYKDAVKEREYRREQARNRRAALKKIGPPIDSAEEKPEVPARNKTIQAPPVTAPVNKPSWAFSIEEEDAARDLIHKSLRIIEEKGFVLWKCRNLNNDLVVIIKDNKTLNYPRGYPVYTLKELKEISGMGDSTIKLIHRIKVVALQDTLPGFAEIIPRSERN